jgi:hypothetical protein
MFFSEKKDALLVSEGCQLWAWLRILFFVKEEAIIVMLTSRNKTMEQVMLVDDGD